MKAKAHLRLYEPFNDGAGAILANSQFHCHIIPHQLVNPISDFSQRLDNRKNSSCLPYVYGSRHITLR